MREGVEKNEDTLAESIIGIDANEIVRRRFRCNIRKAEIYKKKSFTFIVNLSDSITSFSVCQCHDH